ncbi:MAG: glycine cleavage system protein GcvH [Bernardetiaceae bacterium]
MNYPKDLRYTPDHEWVRLEENNIAYVGITDYAQGELGDIVYVDVTTLDEDVAAHDVFGTVEAVKTVSDLYMPVSGKVLELNTTIEDNPQLVNEDPYGEGWLIKIEISDPAELEQLLDADRYMATL